MSRHAAGTFINNMRGHIMATIVRKVYAFGAEKARSWFKGADELRFEWKEGPADVVRLSDFSEDILTAATWHGLSQKLGDSFANNEGLAECKRKFHDMMEQLKAGDWVTTTKGGGIALVVEAIAEASQSGPTPMTIAEAQEAWDSLGENTRKIVKAAPDVKLAMERIKSKRQEAKLRALEAQAESAEGMDLASILSQGD
jgi:hypothetical protein